MPGKLQHQDLEICNEFKKGLTHTVPFVSLKLFGSRSRGEGNADSDFDFLVEVERADVEVRSTVRHIAWKIAFKYNTVFQTIIMTPYQLAQGPERSSLLVQEIQREGVLI